MSFYFKEFTKKNKIIITKKKSDKNVIIVDRGKYGTALYSCLVAAAINCKYKYNVKVLTSKDKTSPIIDFYKSFGIEDFIYGINRSSLIKDIYNFFLTCIHFIKSSIIISCNSIDWVTDKFEIKGVKVGDLIYDSYIQHKRRYIKPKKDIFFFFLVLRTTFKVIKILSLVKKINIKLIIVGTLSYANNDAIFLRIGIKNKIKVLEPSFFHNKNAILEYDNNDLVYGPRHIHHDRAQKKKLENIKSSVNIFNKFIKDRFDNKIKLYHTNNLDVKMAYKTKIGITRNDFLKRFAKNKKYKKIIILAVHAFSDSPHAAGYKLCFRDFYLFFTESLDNLEKIKNKNVLWVIRPHPLSEVYGEKNIVENYLRRYDQKNIILCPKGLSTKNLLEICDTVVTCKGTIGLEFAAYGKMPITCGYPPYSNYGISLESTSKKKYFNTLRNAYKIDYKLSEEKKILAKKILYYMETVIPFKEIRSSQNFQDLFFDLNLNRKDIVWKKLSRKLSENDGFLNDNFYLECLKVL